MLRRTCESGTDVIWVARRETSGWMPELLHRSGEAPIYYVRRIHKTESTYRIKYVGASPLRYLPRIPRRFTSGYPYYIRSGLTGMRNIN
jgi:hypothetical protein